MAFETKAGLLIGIGFIVCFAVVLSHRAPGDQVSAQMAYQVLARHGLKPPTETTTTMANEFARLPFRGADLLPLADEQTGVVDTSTSGARPAIRRAVPIPGVRRGASRQASGMPPADGTNAPSPDSSDSAGPSIAGLSWSALFGGCREDASDDGSSADQAMHSELEAAKAVPIPTNEPNARSALTYSAVANDTLWGVARKAYGRADRYVVGCIFQANRDRMASAGDLKPGTQLVLPVIKGVGAPMLGRQEDRPPSEPAPKKKVRDERSRPKNRTYDVQPGDRYATIAERFLGDKSRWREIHALNKDIFPDPGKIQYGVRIRLPQSE